MSRELDEFELAILNAEIGTLATATLDSKDANLNLTSAGAVVSNRGVLRDYSITVSQRLLAETAFRSEFVAQTLPALLAAPGTWFLIAESDPGFLVKEAQLNGIPKTLFTSVTQSLQTRTLVTSTSSRRPRSGNLYARIY